MWIFGQKYRKSRFLVKNTKKVDFKCSRVKSFDSFDTFIIPFGNAPSFNGNSCCLRFCQQLFSVPNLDTFGRNKQTRVSNYFFSFVLQYLDYIFLLLASNYRKNECLHSKIQRFALNYLKIFLLPSW